MATRKANVRDLGGSQSIRDLVEGPVQTTDIDDAQVTTAKIADDAVTNAKLANMAEATVKLRAAGAGTGDPIDGTADQLATLLRTGTAALSALQSKVISFTRDLTAASGDVAYTGAGFKPSCLIAIAYVNATATHAIGLAASDKSTGTIDYYGSNLVTSNGAFLQIQLADGSASKFQSAAISSYDSDGFTLTWTKTGAPTGTATVYVLCLR